MELRCDLCSAKLAIAGHGGSYNCKHNICNYCYHRYRPPECITCQIKPTAASGSGTQNHAPHTQANPSPQPVVSPTATLQFQMSANANPQPYVLPSAVSQPYAPPCNTPQTSTTLCSTVQHHTSQETWFRLPAPEESEHQNATQGMDGRSDVDQMLNNIQRREQDSNVGQSGTTGNVSQLRKRFDSGGTTAQGGATGWRNREEDARTSQGSSHTSRQQDTLAGHKEPQGTQSNTHSVSPSSEGQRTQLKRHHIRGPQPYPSSFLIKDPYLTNSRIGEPMPLPLGTTNTFPPPESRHPLPSTSSAADRNTNPTRSSSRTRDSSPSSSSARNPSRSSSRNRNTSSSSSSSSVRQTNSSRSSSRTRDQSPPSLNARGRPRSSSRNRDPSSSHPRGRISSPSPAQHTDHSHSSSSPRDPSHPSSRHSSPSLSPLGSRKSSTPSKATEPSTAPPHSNGPMFSGTHSKGEYANDATSHHAATHEPQLKQALTPISTEGLTFLRTHRPTTTTTATMTRGMQLKEQEQWRMEEKGLQGEVMVQREKGDDLQHEELKRRQETQKLIDEPLSHKIDTLQQSAMRFEGKSTLKKEMLDIKQVEWACLKEEYDQQQREIVALKEKDRKHQEELAKLEELSLAQENQAQGQIKALTQENTELKEKVASLGEAKDAQEKEINHWKAEYHKHRAATEEEMRQFKMQECNRLQKDYDKWVLMMTEMQNKMAAKEGEISQYIEKYNNLQNEFQRVQEKWIQSKGEASKLEMENAQHQEEKVKYKEEVRNLKQEMSAKCVAWEGERNLYTENSTMLEVKVASLEEENSSLIVKNRQIQEKLAALRTSKEDERHCLIRERDTCQEEADKLKKDKETLKEKMSQLRKERNDHQLTIQELEHRVSQFAELVEKNYKMLQEIRELKRKKETHQEEATRLRQERDQYKEEVDELKAREGTEVSRLKEERDRYKEEADQLKGGPNSYLENANKLSLSEKKVAELQQERDSMEREIDQLKQKENTTRRERDEYEEKADNLNRELTALENQMTVIKRERDSYKEQIDECETQYDKIVQMVIESNIYKTREDEENSMIALLQQDIHSYKMRVEEHKKNEAALENKITELKTETENHVKELGAQIKQLQWDKGYYKEWANAYERSEATLKNQIKLMERHIENQQKDMDSQIAQLKQEREGYEKEVEAAKRREATLENQLEQRRDTSNQKMEVVERGKREGDECRQKVDQLTWKNNALENQLKQMTRDKDSCKREADRGVREANQLRSKNYELENKLKQMTRDKENIERRSKAWDECKLKVNQLMSKNSQLEAQLNILRYERDKYKDEMDSYKKESDKHKQEIDRLKTRQDAEVTQLRQGTDQHPTVAERLSKQSGAGETGLGERDLSDFLATPTHSQQHTSGAAKVVDVVMAGPEEGATLGLREEQPGTHWLEVPATQGLPNLGNTAYINSVVQCLYHLPPLRNTLATCHQNLYQHNQSGMGVAMVLEQLFLAMQHAYDTDVRMAARQLKSVLGSYDATFSGREQQEAHDLFTALVSCLHNDLSRHGSPDTFPSTSSLFGGQLETSMVCLQTGEPLTHTSEAFTSLSLPVVEAREWFLKDLLNKHFKEQEMDWDCERCHNTHKCSHSTRIRRCPPLLVIHFSRVAHYNSTRKVKVNFPVSGLDLQRYVDPDARPSPQYQLVGVVCHEGSMAYGHYTAYCRYGSGRRSGKWRLCNDIQVREVKERTVLEDESAHMLFYIQQ